MRVVIVDDEPLARALLRRLLAAHADVDIVAEAGDGATAIEAITTHAPDAVFLDIEMPGRDGFGVIAALPRPPAVVFVTAHGEHAIRAFDIPAVDYLLKPFDDERLARALDRLRAPRGRLAVRDGHATVFLALDDIEAVEASGKLVDIRLANGTVHTVRDTLAALEARLDPQRFVRIHRSAIVNVDHVRVVRPFFAGDQEVTLTSGRSLTTGRGFRDRVLARLRR